MKTRRLTLNAMMLALLVVCSQLTIPLPLVPLTLQTFAVGIIATLLPLTAGVEVLAGYILLGMVGLPVFAGMAGGVAVLAGPLGGYIFGFVIYVLVTAGIIKLRGTGWWTLTWANMVGALIQLVLGSIWMVPFNHLTLTGALLAGCVPFIIPGLIKIALVVMVASRVQAWMPNLRQL